jgi:hypothetical protein
MFRTLFLACCIVSFSIGCKTIYLPLCEKFSNTNPSPIKLINKDCYSFCKKEHIKITVLNSNVAMFKGSKRNIDRLKSNYVHLLCNFNQNNLYPSLGDCSTCIYYYQKWVECLNTAKFNRDSLLMFYADKNYCNLCIPGSACPGH